MARSFTATGQRLSAGDVTFMDGLASGTWVTFFKPDWTNSDGTCDVIRKDSCWTPMQRQASNLYPTTIYWNGAGSAFSYACSSYTWTTGLWHFAAIIMDAALKIYPATMSTYAARPGSASLTLAGSGASADTLRNVTNPLIFGNADSLGEQYRGDIEYAAFYAATLTLRELVDLCNYAHPYSVRPTALKFCSFFGSGNETSPFNPATPITLTASPTVTPGPWLKPVAPAWTRLVKSSGLAFVAPPRPTIVNTAPDRAGSY